MFVFILLSCKVNEKYYAFKLSHDYFLAINYVDGLLWLLIKIDFIDCQQMRFKLLIWCKNT